MSSATATVQATFLFTDIEGSTGRWDRQPEQMAADLEAHDVIVATAIEAHGGRVFKHMGDGFCATFEDAAAGVRAAMQAQQDLAAHPWQVDGGIHVRMGLHAGEALSVRGDFFGPSLNRSARIMAAGHGGQVLVSGRVVEAAADDLGDLELHDLGEHQLRGLAQPEHLHQVQLPATTSSFPPLRVLSSYRHNLPNQLATIIGRGREVDEVIDRLGAHRLVTLTGMGGAGKSRMALEVAVEVMPRHAQGVWLAEMAALTAPEFVAMKLAVNLGHAERLSGVDDGDQEAILAQLAKAIGDDVVLLVIDNCDHLLDSIARCVHGLLERCSNLRVLATSREAMGVPGEQVLHVPPLPAPDDDRDDVAAVLGSASGELFVDRARAIIPDFEVTEDNAAAIASICRRLSGLPLAVELAAARVQMLEPEQIDQRLADALRLLRGRSATTTERHQTMQATLEWSHDLLADDERALFRRLAIFQGGFTLEAVEAVCGYDPVDEFDVMDLVEALVSRSLVTFRGGANPRYVLLEVVRQFAEQKLEASGDRTVLAARHFDWVQELVQRSQPVEVVAGTALLLPERHNIRAAFDRALKEGVDGDRLLRLAYDMWRYMLESGQIPEGLAKLEAALANPHSTGTLLEARALDAASHLAHARGDIERALQYSTRAVELCRAVGDGHALAWAQMRHGMATGNLDVDHDEHPFELARRHFEREQHGGSLAWSKVELAYARFAVDDLPACRDLFHEAATIAWEDDATVVALATVGHRSVLLLRGEDTDEERLDDAVADLVAMEMAYTGVRGLLLAACASVAVEQFEQAARYSAMALGSAHQSGAAIQAQFALEWGAHALAGMGDPVTAGMLWGWVVEARRSTDERLPKLIERLQSSMMDDLAEGLGARCPTVLAAGARLTLAEVVRLARQALPVQGA